MAAALCLWGTAAALHGGAPAQTARAFPGNLPFFYDLYTFRGDAGATLVVAAFAVRARHLEAEEAGRGVRYRFDVTLVLADTARRTVTRTDDSVYVALRRPLGGDHLLYTDVQLRARPSRHTYQRVVMSEAVVPGVGQLYRTPFPIPDYHGDTLMLSDVALGQPAARGTGWRRGDVTLALLPTSQFPSSAFDVYYEVYNLPDGASYTTEIRVEPVRPGDGGRPGVGEPATLRFSGEASARHDGSVRELRHVAASLERGAYRLTVTVTDDLTGQSASRSRDFRVRGWGEGATLVGAHSWRPSGGGR